jgi:hypothetical protein
MSKINVFDVKRSHIFYKNEMGDVVIKPNTPYFKAKLLKFDGDRISNTIEPSGRMPHPDDFDYEEEEEIMIQETFNEMIFNIRIGDDSITTRPTMANRVVENLDNVDEIKRIFKGYSEGTTNVELLESVLKTHNGRVVTIGEGWVVDDLFMVSRTGNAYNWDAENNRILEHRTNIGNSVICINVNKNPGIDGAFIDGPEGRVKIDPVGYQIICKINFLLNSKIVLSDKVAVQQMPTTTLEILKRQDPVQPKGSGIFTQHRLDGF